MKTTNKKKSLKKIHIDGEQWFYVLDGEKKEVRIYAPNFKTFTRHDWGLFTEPNERGCECCGIGSNMIMPSDVKLYIEFWLLSK